ncbi:MAG: cobyric acid synthase, partial [Planctomycetota bacterium]
MSGGHGGNLRELAAEAGVDEAEVLDFSANINPLGPPSWLRACISRSAEHITHYPDADYVRFRRAAASHHGVSPDQVVPGNGTSDILWALPRALDCSRAIVPVPAYIDYARSARQAGLDVCEVEMPESDAFELDAGALDERVEGGELVFIGRPNNPTGRVPEADGLRGLARRHPDATFVIDEAFIDFAPGRESLVGAGPANMVVLRSLTKFFAVPALRVGYAVASTDVAEKVREHTAPWSLNCIAERVAREALADEEYARRTRRYVRERRRELFEGLDELAGFEPYPSEANFILVKLSRKDLHAATLQERLLRDGIAVRTCGNFSGLDGRFIRVAVRTEEDNSRLLDALRSAAGLSSRTSADRKGTPALMVQGTSSSAGKTVLAAALCRILLQDGYRVAPFKAQNMSLNSFVTRDGREMGRAQVLQAQACRQEPDVRMNPILLKPTTDVGSQVIVRGKPHANMSAEEYTRAKSDLFPTVEDCYDSLAGEYDAVVLEGAGSPSEINLKEHDIVNMNMARRADAPVLLTGDIDRGGVFASFVGTMELLEDWERELVRGFIVNRFRGDESLLDPALDYTERHTGKPVLGVVPFLEGLNLPDEDSVEFKSGGYERHRDADTKEVTVAVIDLPHISNFTDLDPFRLEPDVTLRVAQEPDDLQRADAIV